MSKHLCKHCKGNGRVPCTRCDATGKMYSGEKCYACQGEKYVLCPVCKGEKYVED